MTRLILTFALSLGTFLAAQAHAAETIAVSYFPGPALAPLFVGMERGAFAQQGLSVTAAPTAGSVAQITAMMAGKYQIAFGALDDGMAYDVGEGAVPVTGKADFVAVMGTDAGSLHLVTAPDVKRVEDLRGRTLAVDAKNTGFAFVLYDVVALHGLKPGAYAVLSVGSSQKRLDALVENKAQGAVMFKPVADQLAAKGFHDILSVSDVLPHYQGAAVLVRRSWARKHRAALVGFIRAYVASARFMLDPANKDQSVAILMRAMHLSPASAASAIAASSGSAGAIGRIDPAGAAAAVRLRERYAEPRKKLGDPRQFYDLSYYRAALRP